MTDDAVTRVTAGLAEDERIAREAIDPDRPGTHWQWVTDETDTPVKPGDEQEAMEHQRISLRTVEHFPSGHGTELPAFAMFVEEGEPGALRHAAHFDPARILGRYVPAIRRVLEVCDAIDADALDGGWRQGHYGDKADEIREALASIYTDSANGTEEP